MRILVADDHEIFRRGLRSILEAHDRWEVCAEAENGLEAVRLVEELNPHIVVLDLNMPVMNGLQALEEIHENNPTLPVVVLTMNNTSSAAQASRERGAKAFVSKEDAVRKLTGVLEELEEELAS